jgi:hypothetical protein
MQRGKRRMIVFDLKCKNGHVFEGWFASNEDFDLKSKEKSIRCPICNDTEIKKLLSPVAINKNRVSETSDSDSFYNNIQELYRKVWDYVDKTFEDVGERFAAEALKIHYGISEPRNIKGTATEQEEKILKEEGVEFFRLPKPSVAPTVNLN